LRVQRERLPHCDDVPRHLVHQHSLQLLRHSAPDSFGVPSFHLRRCQPPIRSIPARITCGEKTHRDLNFRVRPNGKSRADHRRLAPPRPVRGEPNIEVPRPGLSRVHLPRRKRSGTDSRGSTPSSGHLNHESAAPVPREPMTLIHCENRASLFAQLEAEIPTRLSSPTADSVREFTRIFFAAFRPKKSNRTTSRCLSEQVLK
jgi:hypothetical protein